MRLAAVVCLVVLVTACAVRPTVPGTSVPWAERHAQMAALDSWRAIGRIAFKNDEEGGQGSLRWTQRRSDASIRVSGPFGAGAYEINWNPEELVVTSRNGAVAAAYSGSDAAEQFLTAQLGWTFPAVSTRYWILGVPDPASASREQFDDDGWLATIEQNGWLVSYDGFAVRGELWLPRKITMESERGRLRLVVDRWETGELR